MRQAKKTSTQLQLKSWVLHNVNQELLAEGAHHSGYQRFAPIETGSMWLQLDVTLSRCAQKTGLSGGAT